MKLARKIWHDELSIYPIEKLVFLDETSAKTNLAPLRGWSKKGKRCIGSAPGSWQTTTILGAIRIEGIIANLWIDGTLNKPTFKYYMEEILLKSLRPGNVLILDNLRVHKNSFDEKLFEKKKILIKYLPPYSPDFNPIEMMWSKFKTIFRKLQARTKEALYDAMNQAGWAVTLENLAGWFAACGYCH